MESNAAEHIPPTNTQGSNLPVATIVLDDHISGSMPLQWYQLSQNSSMSHTQTDLNRNVTSTYSASNVEVTIKTF
jgi:hypothetical protein